MTPRNRTELVALIGEEALTALENAGCMVVPREATPAMISDMEEMYMPMGEMIAAWDGAMFASPFKEV